MPGLSTSSAFSFAFQEKDPVVTDVTLAILKLHENDFLVKLKRKWWDNANECRQEKEKSMKALCMYAIFPIITKKTLLRTVYLDASKTFCGEAKRDDSQRRFLAQHSVATLLLHCFEWLQHCFSVAMLCCAKIRRFDSSPVTSPLDCFET